MQTAGPVNDPLEHGLADRSNIELHLVTSLGLRKWQAQALTDAFLEHSRDDGYGLQDDLESARIAIHLGMASEKVRRAIDWLRKASAPCAD